MRKLLVTIIGLLSALGVASADSQLQQIADVLDVSTTKTFQVSGNGRMFAVGQSTSPMAGWPRYYVKSMTRIYDFTAGAMRDQWVRTQGEVPPSGGGGQPLDGEQRVVTLVHGKHAWNEAGKNMVPRYWESNELQHQIWISPHGLLRAAFANDATVTQRVIDGREMSVIAFEEKGVQKVIAYANGQNEIEKVESWYAHPVIGDMKVVTYYGAYRDFRGVKFPAKIIQYQDGLPSLDLTVTAVQKNPSINIEVPTNVQKTPVVVKSEKAADGVWYITGASHHSVLIEMKDYVIVIEAPHNEERSAAVMAEVKKLVPGKPIKYLVNTHHHFDHSGGVRAYAAEGVTIVTHEINRPYFEKAVNNSHNYAPDRLAKSGKKPVFQTMGDNMVLTDGSRSVELYQIVGNAHHDGLIMAYLRKEKLLVEADAYTPPAVPKVADPFSVNLEANVRRLRIDVDKILPLHGNIVPYGELLKAIGKAPAKK